MSGILPQYGIPSPALGPWAANLQPASSRGVPFAVEVDTYRGGRRIVLHEYPYRDDPWPEDTGRATRRITITGFLLGDDVFA
ncbi:MAG TPA: DNA circularization N-terminal domain-containing protein [Acetobacteraceae bacterium]|nr:DNA circularization N-terminal domain-containing protein [Acetobacteraceae bacterium]